MRILGISGSNRKGGNSYLFLKEILKGLSSVETEIIQIAELDIKPCEFCIEACSARPFECVIDDDFKVLFEKMKIADGVIFGVHSTFMFQLNFKPFLKE